METLIAEDRRMAAVSTPDEAGLLPAGTLIGRDVAEGCIGPVEIFFASLLKLNTAM